MTSHARHLYWFHPHFYNWMGGHLYVLEVAQQLKQSHQLRVTIITEGMGPEAQRQFKRAGIPVITLSGLSTFSPWYWLALPLFVWLEYGYLRLVKRLDRSSLYLASMFPASVLAQLVNSRTVQLCYEPYAFFHDHNFTQGFAWPQRAFIQAMKWLYQDWDRRVLKRAHQVLTISRENQKWIKKVYGVLATVVYEGVDTEFFKPTHLSKLRKKYQNTKVIFHSTDYTPIKGTPSLIKAFAQVVKTEPSTRLLISETLPHSPAKVEVEQLIRHFHLEKHVEFLGFLPRIQLPAYLSLARVVVQPSIRQSMNLTIKEAMACQTPVVTSPEGYEQTPSGEAGILVSPHQTEKLAHAITFCLARNSKTRQMGARGRALILERFSWKAVSEAIWSQLEISV